MLNLRQPSDTAARHPKPPCTLHLAVSPNVLVYQHASASDAQFARLRLITDSYRLSKQVTSKAALHSILLRNIYSLSLYTFQACDLSQQGRCRFLDTLGMLNIVGAGRATETRHTSSYILAYCRPRDICQGSSCLLGTPTTPCYCLTCTLLRHPLGPIPKRPIPDARAAT